MNQEQQRMFAGVTMNTIAKEYDQTRPAFPCPPSQHSNGFYSNGNGMTLREYAAIQLRVPDSGLSWLDEMITKANRDYFAAAALQGLMANSECNKTWDESDVAKFCYEISNEMLKAREVKP